VEHDAVGGALGAVAGASMGLIAGPPGIIAGAMIGAVVGAVATEFVSERAAESDAHDRDLDLEIGVKSDEIGAPNLDHPPAKTGAYTVAIPSSGEAPAEGPMQVPES